MEMNSKASVICFVFFTTFAAICKSEDFLGGCGGFVKSSVDINFSRIEVKLYTKQGSLKYQTDCAPNNGYFMIPIYDKGDFILKLEPPKGWTFDPVSVDLHIDGETDKCSRGEDINFQFTGFTVSGSVVSKGQQEGPAGVTVTLKAKGDSVAKQQVTTATGGKYSFPEVLPGDYIVTASHPKWTIKQSEVSLAVSRDSGGESAPIEVSGYDVQGQVRSEGEPIKDVYFILFSSTIKQQDVLGCNTSPVTGFKAPAGKSALCSVQSNHQGVFVFPSLPTGQYSVVPFYKGEHITFDVIPTSMEFAVKHDSLQLKTDFKVEGFSVSGRVILSPGGKGVEGALVSVQGKKEVTTKADGSFQLEKIKSDTYVITVTKEHVFFESTTMKINPNTPRLPDIIASRFNLCGRVSIDKPPTNVAKGNRKVILTPEGSKAKDTVTKTTQPDGSYCFEVAPGNYVIQPVVSDDETKSGLKLTPTQRVVKISSRPEFDVNFSQFKASVRGVIKCLDICGNLQMRITTEDGQEERPQVQISQQTKQAPFQLRDVLPGKYQVTVIQNNWCLKSATLDVTVGEQDVTGLEFIQTGFLLQCHSTHPTALQYHHGRIPKDVKKFDLKSGLNQFCLEIPGKYHMQPQSCHQFDQESYDYDTSSPNMLTISAVKHLVTGVVVAKQQASDVTITIKSSIEAEPDVTLGPLKSKESLVTEKKTKEPKVTKPVAGSGNYEFSYWARNGEQLEITPSSQQILFYPHMVQVTVRSATGSGCVGQVAEFEGRAGVFVAGQISPPLNGVMVTVHTIVKEGEEKRPPINVETNQEGKYRVGPLPDTADYDVDAALDGYILTPDKDRKGIFKASKLGDITVKVVDESEQPLQGVLLSLSGGQYRSNNFTDANGAWVFSGLGPNQYFLKPMMKEYKFEPGSQILDVAEGASEKLTIKGQRVAFSCYGVVTSLNGEPEPNIALEAHGTEGCGAVLEESVSDQDGKFRIRGLQPKCTYELQLRSGGMNSHIERSAPKTHTIKVEGKDIENIRIIVFRHLNQFEIGGNVITASDFVPTLKVLLYREDNLDSPLQTLSLGTSSFFQFPSLPIDNKKYVMRLDSSLSKSSYEYALPEASFTTQGYHKHITLRFEPSKRSVEQEISQGSYLALPLLVAVIAIALNHTKIVPILQQMFQSVRTLQPVGAASDAGKDTSASSDERKKKQKPRKT